MKAIPLSDNELRSFVNELVTIVNNANVNESDPHEAIRDTFVIKEDGVNTLYFGTDTLYNQYVGVA